MNEPIAKKQLGQHWLHDITVLESMAANVAPGDVVLEVGPGTGTLTSVLLQKGAKVVAVEMDKSLGIVLGDKFKNADFKLHFGSILEFDLTKLPQGYKVIANIPYYLTSNLVRVLSESANPPVYAALLVQKEVAQRVSAPPGQMSLLSVSAQYYWDVTVGMEVPARLFTPPPKVDSQILILSKKHTPAFKGVDDKLFFRVVKAGFGERRKTISNSLSGGLRITKDQAKQILGTAGIDPVKRAQTLSLADWHKLYTSVKQHLAS